MAGIPGTIKIGEASFLLGLKYQGKEVVLAEISDIGSHEV